MGKDKEAEQLILYVLSYREITPVSANASTIHNLAQLYRDRGDFNEAAQLLQDALNIKEKTLQPLDPSIAETLDALATIYQLQNKNIEEVEPLYMRSLYIKEQVLEPKHPDIAITAVHHADISSGREFVRANL